MVRARRLRRLRRRRRVILFVFGTLKFWLAVATSLPADVDA